MLNAKKELEAQQDKMQPAKYRLGINSFDGLIKELEHELQEYNSLSDGTLDCLHGKNFEDIPKIFIASRIAQGLTHEQLGEIIGIKGQQVQRYEATNFETASWVRMVEFYLALNPVLEFIKVPLKKTISTGAEFAVPSNITKANVDACQLRASKERNLIFLDN